MLPSVLKRRVYQPNVWDDFFGKDFMKSFLNENWSNANVPAVNVVKDKKEYRIEVAAPGLDKKDLKINVEKNVLTISSELEESKEEKAKGFIRKEFNYSSFSRSFSLPEDTNAEKIKATHKHGVLTVVLPKNEVVNKNKEIKIS